MTRIEIETHTLFHNVDTSILNANVFLKKYGFEFVSFNLAELEAKFSLLLSIPPSSERADPVRMPESDVVISHRFHQALMQSHSFGMSASFLENVVFLKSVETFHFSVNAGWIHDNDASTRLHKIHKFKEVLVQQFRLFKSGDIEGSKSFLVANESREISHHISPSQSPPVFHPDSVFTLTPAEAVSLGADFNDAVSINPLTDLAIKNFTLAYSIQDQKTKFLILMISIECLFNHGADQVTHTVSRHLALIQSNSAEAFYENYRRVKKLYNVRSQIVHGSSTNEDLAQEISELQEMVRTAINYCKKLYINKTQLFEKLNVAGLVVDG
jgi:Apea-like HEPN